MNVRELRKLLFELDQEAIVTVRDFDLDLPCHVHIDASIPGAVEIESNGVVVTEEDVS